MLIFVVLITQFNSVTTPFVIMSSVVLSMMGVLIGLLVTRMSLPDTPTLPGFGGCGRRGSSIRRPSFPSVRITNPGDPTASVIMLRSICL